MKGREQWEQDVRNRQRNVVFPDTLLNETRFYQQIINGTQTLTLLQRVGALLVGSTFLTFGAVEILVGVYSGRMLRGLGAGVLPALLGGLIIAVVLGAIGLTFGYLGGKLLLAGIRTRGRERS